MDLSRAVLADDRHALTPQCRHLANSQPVVQTEHGFQFQLRWELLDNGGDLFISGELLLLRYRCPSFSSENGISLDQVTLQGLTERRSESVVAVGVSRRVSGNCDSIAVCQTTTSALVILAIGMSFNGPASPSTSVIPRSGDPPVSLQCRHAGKLSGLTAATAGKDFVMELGQSRLSRHRVLGFLFGFPQRRVNPHVGNSRAMALGYSRASVEPVKVLEIRLPVTGAR